MVDHSSSHHRDNSQSNSPYSHHFTVCRSRDQQLALVSIAAVCLASFLAWPSLEHIVYTLLRSLCFISMLALFIGQFIKLKHWQCSLTLNSWGEGLLNGDIRFQVVGKVWVTPLCCFFYIESDKGRDWLLLWRDMFDDTSYRHLCRLLLNYQSHKD